MAGNGSPRAAARLARSRPGSSISTTRSTRPPAGCSTRSSADERVHLPTACDLSPEAALALQKTYFREHGTTMRGLMTVHRIDPHEFLAFVHEVDLACVPADPALVAALSGLPGRKIVHTNGSVPHAERLLDHLGISRLVQRHRRHRRRRISSRSRRSPAYRELLRRHEVAPDDRADGRGHGAKPGPGRRARHDHGLGAQPVDWAAAGSEGDHIHHIVDDLGRLPRRRGRVWSDRTRRPAHSRHDRRRHDPPQADRAVRPDPARDRRRFAPPCRPRGRAARRRDAFRGDHRVRGFCRAGPGGAAAAGLRNPGRRAGDPSSRAVANDHSRRTKNSADRAGSGRDCLQQGSGRLGEKIAQCRRPARPSSRRHRRSGAAGSA